MNRIWGIAILFAVTSSAHAQDAVFTNRGTIIGTSIKMPPTYTLEPKDDITAPELSKAFVAILPALACHNALGIGCDPSDNIEALPPEVRRHFVKHEH